MTAAFPQVAASERRSRIARVLSLLPQLLTGLRLLSAPLIWWLVTNLEFQSALVWLGFAMVSDAVDGSLVRRFGVPSRAGAYFDATADFAVIAAAFSAFAHLEIYPAWLTTLITLTFLVFLLSSRLTPTIYDPIGRYIGGILFVAIAATLLFQDFLVQRVILWAATASLAFTLGARATFMLTTTRYATRRGAAAARRAANCPQTATCTDQSLTEIQAGCPSRDESGIRAPSRVLVAMTKYLRRRSFGRAWPPGRRTT